MKHAGWLSLILLLGAASCAPRMPVYVLPIPDSAAPLGAAAWTECLGGRIDSYINTNLLGADSTDEILYHESIHRRQERDSVAKNGACTITRSAGQVLTWEMEAYCASDSLRAKRTDPFEAKTASAIKLLRQFHSAMPANTILDSWSIACP